MNKIHVSMKYSKTFTWNFNNRRKFLFKYYSSFRLNVRLSKVLLIEDFFFYCLFLFPPIDLLLNNFILFRNRELVFTREEFYSTRKNSKVHKNAASLKTNTLFLHGITLTMLNLNTRLPIH